MGPLAPSPKEFVRATLLRSRSVRRGSADVSVCENFGASPSFFSRLELLLVLSQLLFHCSGNLMYPCSCLFHFSLVLFTPKRACRCVPVHFLSIRIPTCRTLVTARALVLTNPGPVSTQAANPNLHRSACHYRSRPWHGHDSRHALHPRIHI